MCKPEYLGVDGPDLLRQVKQVFAPYDLEDSDFKIGDDDYLRVTAQVIARSGGATAATVTLSGANVVVSVFAVPG